MCYTNNFVITITETGENLLSVQLGKMTVYSQDEQNYATIQVAEASVRCVKCMDVLFASLLFFLF